VKILKVAKGFGITIVVCFALFGAYKLFKPAPVIDVPEKDMQYLRDIGINVAEDGKASENGTSPLFGTIDGVLPLNSAGDSQFQTPPAAFGNNADTNNGAAPPFGFTDHNNSGTNTPPLNPTPSAANTTGLNSAPTWDFGQETNTNSTPTTIPLTNSPVPSTLPASTTSSSSVNLPSPFSPTNSNPSLTANLPRQVEPTVIAPSSPYASQHRAPPLTVPPSIMPATPTTSITPTAPTPNLPPPQPFTPTLPTTPTTPIAPHPSPHSHSSSQPLSSSPVFLPVSESQSFPVDATAAHLPNAFVNTGLRDNSTATITANSTTQLVPKISHNNQPHNPTINSFNPITTTHNDPNYYSSAVPVAATYPPTTSAPKQDNSSFESEMVVLEKPSQSNISPAPATTLNNENQHNNNAVIKPLPSVIEHVARDTGKDKTTLTDTNNRYIHTQNNNSDPNPNSNPNTVNDGTNLWDGYLKAAKPNNEAVLAPARDAVGDIAARVAFAKEEAGTNDNSSASNNVVNSADIFPNLAVPVVSSPNVNRSADGVVLANPVVAESRPPNNLTKQIKTENSSVDSSDFPESVGGVVATSGSVLVDHAIAGLTTKINNSAAGKNTGQDNSKQNKEKESTSGIFGETKFDSTVIDVSPAVPVIPFVAPPVAPQPVLVTNDLTSGNIFADKKPREHSPEQQIRESTVNFVTEQVREYNTKENTKMHLAFVQLSKFYDQHDLNDVERDYVAPVLDRVALELIYSAKYHVLEPVYRVKFEDTVETIARRFSISPELLRKINGLNYGERLLAGGELKVVYGQFDAKVHTKRGELTLLLGGVYAGRFPVVIGRNIINIRGEFIVQNKTIAKDTKILTLNNGIKLNGLGRHITQDSLGVSKENIEELFDILTENSVIVMEE
jgi:hypothetical protein